MKEKNKSKFYVKALIVTIILILLGTVGFYLVNNTELIKLVNPIEKEQATATYSVSTPQSLISLNPTSGSTINITEDLDFTGITCNPNFLQKNNNVTINGQGHVLSGINITADITDYVSIFGKNMTINDLGIINSTIKGRNYVGGFFNNTGDYGVIKNCYMDSTCTVTGTNYVGGLAGYLSGTITTSYNGAIITGDKYVGGIIGYGNEGEVTYCYNRSIGGNTPIVPTIVGKTHVGGIAGYQSSSAINHCYNVGIIQGTTNVSSVVRKLG